MSLPTTERLAHHEAGHAVVQHWISEGRFQVTRVALDSDGETVAGSSLIDNNVTLGLYQFGLVVLAGIAAENRYFLLNNLHEGDHWGAVGDIEEWLSAARDALQSEARVEIVTRNVLRRLREFFQAGTTWSVVSELAQLLISQGVVEGERLQGLLRGDSATREPANGVNCASAGR